MDQQTIDLVLEGEFQGEFASEAAKEARNAHIVTRKATVRSTQAAHAELDECTNGGYWAWGDNSVTIVDIRPK